MMQDDPVRPWRWTRNQYDRLIESGVFQEDDKVELLGGQLMVAEPQGSRHAATVGVVADTLRAAFGRGWYVAVQVPVALDDESEPEPDVTVSPGTARDYGEAHPSRPVLVVEVAESSRTLDRRHKASLYARAEVPDYWIVNVVDNVLEVHRRSVPSSQSVFGWRYADVVRLVGGATISPVAVPSISIAVADLLL